jgi:DNA sulfur modification protein DndE
MKNTFFLLAFLCLGFTFPKTKVRIFMIGDSTMANKQAYDFPETGWGQVFNEVFTDAVVIHNHALNGRSTKSFRTEGHWKKVIDQVQKGDYVFIQFGHNDQKVADTSKYAPSQTLYRTNLQLYIDETVAKGGIPVLFTPVVRRKFDDHGVFVDQHGDYPTVVKEVARKNGIGCIDLHGLSLKLLEKLGSEASKDLFMNFPGGVFPKFVENKEDNTHFSPFGARLMANLVAEDFVTQALPLRNWLKKSVYPNTFVYQLPQINVPHFKKDTFSVVKYGAKANGLHLNTTAINMAIDMAHENGGGTVLVPAGLWLSGPIVLKSHVNLHLASGAVLQFSNRREDYPVIETTWEGNAAFRCQAPISGVGLVNVGLTGLGSIDGAGQVWKHVKKAKLTDTQWKTLLASGGVLNDKKDTWYPSEASKYGNENMAWTNKKVAGKTLADYEKIRDFLRPNMVSLTQCRNVLMDGPTFVNSPAWTLHPLLCSHITIRNVHVKNPWFGQNNDALDLESCNNGQVENCTFDTGDDAICLKSGKDEEGRLRAKPTENIIIRNNTVFHGHGGVVIGSEMSGGVRQIYVNNCSFLGTDIGLRFKTKRDRGGVVENVFISDISMSNIPGEAILFDMYYEAKDPVPLEGESQALPLIQPQPLGVGTPAFRSFFIENVMCKGAETAILLRGLPEMNIKDITIMNSNFIANKGLVCVEADGVMFRNVGIFANTNTPFLIQNSKQITFDGLQFNTSKNALFGISGPQNKAIVLKNTKWPHTTPLAVFERGAQQQDFVVK